MTRSRTITIHEIHSLADRLVSCSVGAFGTDAPDAQCSCDVWLAAKVILAMARSFNRGDAVTINGE
jgi:hypothetical protein